MRPEPDRHDVAHGSVQSLNNFPCLVVVLACQHHPDHFIDAAVLARSTSKSMAPDGISDHGLPQHLAAARFRHCGGPSLVETEGRQVLLVAVPNDGLGTESVGVLNLDRHKDAAAVGKFEAAR